MKSLFFSFSTNAFRILVSTTTEKYFSKEKPFLFQSHSIQLEMIVYLQREPLEQLLDIYSLKICSQINVEINGTQKLSD